MRHFYFYSDEIVLNGIRVSNINIDLPTDYLFSYNSQTRIFTIHISDTSKQNYGNMSLFSNSHFENINGDYGSIGSIYSFERQPAIHLIIFNTTIINSHATTYGGAFVIQDLPLSSFNLTFLRCNFKNVRGTEYGGILYAIGSQDYKAINLVAINSSIIEDTSQISIGPQFIFGSAYRGGSIYLDYTTQQYGLEKKSVDLDISYFFILNSTSFSDGGFLYVSGNIKLYLKLQLTNFEEISASIMEKEFDNIQGTVVGGGFASLILDELDIFIFKCSFTRIGSFRQGGGIFLIKSDKVAIEFSNVEILEVLAQTQGGIMYVKAQNYDIKFQNVSIRCNSSNDYNPNFAYNKATLFYLDASNDLISRFVGKFINYENCGTANEGGIFNLNNNALLNVTNTNYTNISASKGGIIYCTQCQIIIHHSLFTAIDAQYGSIIYINGNTMIHVEDSVFLKNSAYYADDDSC
ncbi:UNKNOWN [Stylonychia lemnae]|uniref:Uncharacterized protein n=1 Tax=Stylonychia lemnae TaxID=5949 RepID=A0A078B6J4_STYLE|nr:UNKNOWN [Stylonychia lemnae]|eukprot:CDW90150.1 UNKNOWN [Stylonychia lemnae]